MTFRSTTVPSAQRRSFLFYNITIQILISADTAVIETLLWRALNVTRQKQIFRNMNRRENIQFALWIYWLSRSTKEIQSRAWSEKEVEVKYRASNEAIDSLTIHFGSLKFPFHIHSWNARKLLRTPKHLSFSYSLLSQLLAREMEDDSSALTCYAYDSECQ